MSKRSFNIDGYLYIRADLVRADEVDLNAHASRIIQAVSSVALVQASAITGRGRRDPLMLARAACVFMMYENGLSWSAIGRALGRHHSSVMAYRERFFEPETERMVEAAKQRLKGAA